MKPTKDEVLAWAREATKAINADEEILHTKVYVEKLAALAYAAGAAAMKERAAKVCEEFDNSDYAAGDSPMPYDYAEAIRALGDDDE